MILVLMSLKLSKDFSLNFNLERILIYLDMSILLMSGATQINKKRNWQMREFSKGP